MNEPSDRQVRRANEGFTLVELLIAVGLIGLLATAVSAAIIVFLRSESSVVSRLTNSQDLSNIENYLPGDVASANIIRTSAPWEAGLTQANCLNIVTAGSGTPIIQLGWDQRWRDGSTSEYEVIYAYDAAAGEIRRHECVNNAASEAVVARRFDGAPTVNRPDVDPHPVDEDFSTVELVLDYADDARRIAATSRNYNP